VRRPALLVLVVATLALGLAACGGNDSSSPKTAATTEPAATAAPTTTAPSSNTNLDEKPTVKVPKGDPPKQLKVRDIVVGKGARAESGDDVSVQYVGVAYSNGQEFDTSWGGSQAFSFPLGAGRVIPGWDKGVAGMRVGGRRELIIPPDLAYGDQGAGGAIGPGETLIFIVDLVGIQ